MAGGKKKDPHAVKPLSKRKAMKNQKPKKGKSTKKLARQRRKHH